MGVGPVQQGQFELRHPGQQVGVILALAHLGGHVGTDVGDAGIVGMGLVGDQQVQLGVLLDLHAQLIQTLDGGVAGEEVLGTRAEGDDLQVLHAQDGPGDGHELGDLVRQFLGSAHGVLGDVGAQVAHAQVVGAVQHAAVGVAAAVLEPKEMIFRSFTPRMVRAMGTNSAILSASSSAVPTGYSGM